MNYKQAIKLLAPYHAAELIWVNPDSTPTAPTGQLTTGNPDHPLIPVDSGMVIADDLYTILDSHQAVSRPLVLDSQPTFIYPVFA